MSDKFTFHVTRSPYLRDFAPETGEYRSPATKFGVYSLLRNGYAVAICDIEAGKTARLVAGDSLPADVVKEFEQLANVANREIPAIDYSVPMGSAAADALHARELHAAYSIAGHFHGRKVPHESNNRVIERSNAAAAAKASTDAGLIIQPVFAAPEPETVAPRRRMAV